MTSQQCQNLLGDLSAYLDGDASGELCAEIERHLEDCRDCRAVVDTLRKTLELVHDLPQQEIPQAVRARLMDEIK